MALNTIHSIVGWSAVHFVRTTGWNHGVNIGDWFEHEFNHEKPIVGLGFAQSGMKAAIARWRIRCDPAAVAASLRPRCDLRQRQGNRRRWTGGASATWTKRVGSGKCGPS